MSGTVLVAEDDRVLAHIIKFNLDRAGFQVTVVHDGMAAIDAALICQYDLIVLDFQMPIITGESVAEHIRAVGLSTESPIIFCTGKSLGIDREYLGETLQISEFIMKPFSPKKLVEVALTTVACGVVKNPNEVLQRG